VPLDPGPHRHVGAGGKAVGLHDPHFDQRAALRRQGVERPLPGRGRQPGLGPDRLGEMGQGPRVDPVGLGQAPGPLAKPRAWRGLTAATGMPAACSAATADRS
jgi:hypothetical protein